MCGFVVTNIPVIDEKFQTVVAAIDHRGPDSQKMSEVEGIRFGFNRLAIIDLNPRADQPMICNDQYILVYNGEIYNFQELRQELLDLGVTFITNSDTEVLYNMLILYGEKCLAKLNGMFAFLFYNRKEDLILVGRDRMGVKPLYYYMQGNNFIVSSELKCIQMILKTLTLSTESIAEYAQYRFLSGNKTFFREAEVLPQGTYGIFKNEEFVITPFFQKSSRNDRQYKSEKIEQLLLASLEKQLYADVPVGFFLSGGIDSSLLVAMATKALQLKVDTFSVVFDNYEHDERYYQQLVVNDCRTQHHEFVSNQENFFKDFLYTTFKGDTPLLIPNCTPIYQLAKLAKNYVKVLITGEGADELFGGYGRFRWTVWKKYFDKDFLRPFWKAGAMVKPAITKFTQDTIFNQFISNMQFMNSQELAEFTYLPPYQNRLSGQERFNLNDLLFYDQEVYLHGLLQRVDNMTMLASIEARVPFLDNEVIDYVNNIDFFKKIGLFKLKKILQKIAARYLPAEIIHRPKVGFPLPLGYWLTLDHGLGKLKYLLLDDISKSRGYVRQDNLREIFKSPSKINRYAESVIFPLLSLEVWQRMVLEGGKPSDFFYE
jgi:asparagine synthase (glutamine-hydrolysing)